MDVNAMPLPQVLYPFREQIEQSVLPFIRIKTVMEETSDIWQSKFGGLPYLPPNIPYPVDAHEKPMMLLAQIDCSALPPIDPFPKEGIMQFYVADEDLYGLNLDDPTRQENFRVLYFEKIEQNVFRTDFDFLPDFVHAPITQTYSLHFEKTSAPVGTEDIHFDSVFGASSYSFFKKLGTQGEEAKKEYRRAFSASGHKLGGYAHFTQEDPRWIQEAYAEAILLLQIDSDGVGIHWGDQGIAHFFILPEDLRKLDFSRVLYHWDAP